MPGQQLHIDLKSATAVLSGPDHTDKKALGSVDSVCNKGIVVKENGVRHGKVNWGNTEYSFSDQSLSQVFKRIEKRYGITIAFKDAEIENYRFTGKVMYKDSLDMVMRHLCQLYDLKYTRAENNITIEKVSENLRK
ncbi:DUF4974 domain-containing protein [Niabella ginsengisoli]|uniref:DUF4974 domain-containing protein n=1 Tax=Niabella ginsengisoli TaxID=522298 RepID=A0ABS9SMR4_9BACT|nr:DUF4974 domain-containing protein [Niabella ginsengisoli]MCH5599645.1 DUF4974 domain-containing protein [Niabella ginsengisoli]